MSIPTGDSGASGGRPGPGPSNRRTALNREARKAIGHQLQSLYDEVVKAPIPDRFVELLRRLETPGERASED